MLLYKGAEKQISGYAEESTNNRMELTAVLMGLCALKEPCEVTVYTDSAYISNAFHNGWTLAWERNGWINSQKKPVENQDLWISLLNKVRDHKVTLSK